VNAHGYPEEVNILGVVYRIEYTAEVLKDGTDDDVAALGHIDYVNRVIRVFEEGRQRGDVWSTIIHEIVHGITEDIKIRSLSENHDDLERLAVCLTDTLIRNGWMF
jgi:hypothetical protein